MQIHNFFKGDQPLWIVYMTLVMVSVLEVYTSEQALTLRDNDTFTPILVHLAHHLLGFAVLWVSHLVPVRWFRLATIILPVSWILLICIQLFSGLVNGAVRWLFATELCKLTTIISIALILARTQDDKSARPTAFSLVLKVLLPSVILIAPDNLSSGLILLFTGLSVMFIGRIPARQLFGLLGLLFIGASLLVATAKFTPDSVLIWLNNQPGLHRLSTWCRRLNDFGSQKEINWDLSGPDAQRAAGYMAIVNGKWLGVGVGNTFMTEYLPLAFSDFIFAIIIEELGIPGCIFVVYLYIIFIVRSYRIARGSPNTFSSLMVSGLAVLLFIQAVINMFVAVGIAPITGQPLPLLSRGGWSIISSCMIWGIILNVSRYQTKKRINKSNKL